MRRAARYPRPVGGMLACGYQPQPGRCAYHQHDPRTGAPINGCERAAQPGIARCRKHDSSGGTVYR